MKKAILKAVIFGPLIGLFVGIISGAVLGIILGLFAIWMIFRTTKPPGFLKNPQKHFKKQVREMPPHQYTHKIF